MVQVEEFLASYCRGSKNKRDTWFYSKIVYDRWMAGKRDKSMMSLLTYYRTNVLEGGQTDLPIKRAEYCLALWRLAAMAQHCLEKGEEQELAIMERFAVRIRSLDPALSVVLAMLKLAYSKEKVEVEASLVPMVVEQVVKAGQEIPQAPHPSWPPVLLHSCLPKVVDRLLALPSLPPHQPVLLLLAKSRTTWAQGSYSTALDCLHAATTAFLLLARDTGELEPAILSCSLPLVTAWHTAATVAVQQKLGPVLDYMLALAEVAARGEGSTLGLLPSYLLLLAAREQRGQEDLVRNLEDRLPPGVREEKLERSFQMAGMPEERRAEVVGRYVGRLLRERQVVLAPAPTITNATAPSTAPTSDSSEQFANVAEEDKAEFEETASPESEIEVTEELQQQVLDIAVLELVAGGQTPELVQLLLSSLPLLPPLPALAAMADMLEQKQELGSLEKLCQSLPQGGREHGLVFAARSRLHLKAISEEREKEGGLVAWVRLVELYGSVRRAMAMRDLEQEAGTGVLLSCLKHARLHAELGVLKVDQEMLQALRIGGEAVAADHRDPALLVLLWEALFFAPNFEEQKQSETMVTELPWLVLSLPVEQVRIPGYLNYC